LNAVEEAGIILRFEEERRRDALRIETRFDSRDGPETAQQQCRHHDQDKGSAYFRGHEEPWRPSAAAEIGSGGLALADKLDRRRHAE